MASKGDARALTIAHRALGRGIHSSTSQFNLSRFVVETTRRIPQKCLH